MQQGDQRAIRYLEFRQHVRRYPPSALIPALAQVSARQDLAGGGYRVRSDGSDMPWVAAAIARDSIVHSNEYRHSVITSRTLSDLYAEFNQTDDSPMDPSASSLVTPLFYEQFTYQESPFEELSRIFALLEDSTLGAPFPWASILGLELHEAVRALLILRVWVAQNIGRYDPAILDLPHFSEVFERAAPRAHIEAVAKLLTTTPAEARVASAAAMALPASLQRFAFNPLVARPFVDLGPLGIWCPQTMLVDRAFNPGNLYYRGIKAWGKRFADDLGSRVEAYTGTHLALVARDGDLSSEIEYRDGKQQKKSVDWLWTSPDAVVLFECKSARMTLGARAGDPSLPALIERSLTKAREQLDATAALIRARVPPFDRFPVDRPLVGVVVTAEPFYLANSRLPEYGANSAIPSTVMSLRDLEHWVTWPTDQVVPTLLAALGDDERQTWSVSRAIGMPPGNPRNPILERAWREYDFEEVRKLGQ